MKKKLSKQFICIIFLILLFNISSQLGFSQHVKNKTISISGLVERPLVLTIDDLKFFREVTLRSHGIDKHEQYKGSFFYTGISLKDILSFCKIRKLESDFYKNGDIFISIKNKKGEESILSWGEVFYSNVPDIIVAYEYKSSLPMFSCIRCHSNMKHLKWKSELNRKIKIPKLVLVNDKNSERSIEDITSIEVINVIPSQPFKKKINNYSGEVKIFQNKKLKTVIRNLNKYRKKIYTVTQIGDGRGFHGRKKYLGIPLIEVLKKNKILLHKNDIIQVTGMDGYRSVLSGGELIYSKKNNSIILADKINGKSIKNNGKFHFITTADLLSDRWVRGLKSISINRNIKDSKLYIISIGCGDSNLMTLDAINYINKADAFICTADIRKRFSHYIQNKPILFDSLITMVHYYRMKNPEMSLQQARAKVTIMQKQQIVLLKKYLNNGKTVAFLDYGDPTLYGSWTYWLPKYIDRKKIIVRPGVSAFNAANAMIGRNLASQGSIIITVPKGIRDNESMIKSIASHGDTLAIFVGLKELKFTVPILKKYYNGKTPVKVVIKAGYSKTGKIVNSDLDHIVNCMEVEREKFLGIIYVGERLSDNILIPKRSNKCPFERNK